MWPKVEPRQPLADALGAKVLVLGVGRPPGKQRGQFARLELSFGNDLSADRIITRLIRLIEALPPDPKALWRGARLREFNIGIQAESQPHDFALALAPKTVQLVAEQHARLSVTVYAPEMP